MTLDEARTIWLTLLGSDWIAFVDVISNPHYYGTLDAAYMTLRSGAALDVDLNRELVKIKCY